MRRGKKLFVTIKNKKTLMGRKLHLNLFAALKATFDIPRDYID